MKSETAAERLSAALIGAREKRGWSLRSAATLAGIPRNVLRALEGEYAASGKPAAADGSTKFATVARLCTLYHPEIQASTFLPGCELKFVPIRPADFRAKRRGAL